MEKQGDELDLWNWSMDDWWLKLENLIAFMFSYQFIVINIHEYMVNTI